MQQFRNCYGKSTRSSSVDHDGVRKLFIDATDEAERSSTSQ